MEHPNYHAFMTALKETGKVPEEIAKAIFMDEPKAVAEKDPSDKTEN